MAFRNVFLQSTEAPHDTYAKDEEEVRSMLLDEDNGPRREKRRRDESEEEPARNVRRFDAHGPLNAAPSPRVAKPVVNAHANLNPAAPHAVSPIVDAPVNPPPIQVNVLPNIALNPPMLPAINPAIRNPLLVRRRLPTRRALAAHAAAATRNLPPATNPPANPFVVNNPLVNVTANPNQVVVANPVDTVNSPVAPPTGSSEEEESDDEGYLGEPESDSGSAIASGSGVTTEALDRSTGKSRRRRYTKTAADWSNGGKRKAKESYSTFSHEESSASFSEDEIQYGEGDYNEEDSDSDAFFAQRIADAIAASRGAAPQVLISPLTAIHIPVAVAVPVTVTAAASPPSPPFFLPVAPRPLRRTYYTMAQL